MRQGWEGPLQLDESTNCLLQVLSILVMWFYKGISKSWSGTQQATLKMIKCVAYRNSK